jgi:iron complex outermembrane receptor protein
MKVVKLPARRPLAAAIALIFTGAGVPATAQDLRVDVTGSNIKRIEAEGALPVQIITREDIEREGVQTAAQVVERLAANVSIGGLNLQGSEGGSNVGYASASLRGLGEQRTLVLLNGRRLANTAFSGEAVDLNAIPLSAIERVEVLTDGASAIYGTDAIAGVINFILRKDFRGVEVNAYYGDSEQGGGRQQRYNVTGGFGDLDRDRYNVYATLDYYKQNNIKASERSFSRTAYLPYAPGGLFDKTSGNSFPGNVFLPPVPGREAGTSRSPAFPGCEPPFSFPTETAATAGQCRFDYASVIDIVPPSESWNAFGTGRWRFHRDHELFVEAAWSRTESIARVSPPPVSSATILSGESVVTNPGTPFYPTALAAEYGVADQPLEVFWRGLELGPRTDKNTIEQTRFVAGLQGLLAGWDYSTAINTSRSKAQDEWIAGWSRGSTLLPILNSGRINLFGFNDESALAELRTALIIGKVLEAKGGMTEFDIKASRDVYKLPAGPLALAVGAVYRNEEFEYISSEATQEADVPGFGGSVPSVPKVDRNIYAVFAEVNIPVTKELEVNVAVRFDDYQGIGNTTNPKVSVRWAPVRQLLLRAAAGTGFRAPSMPELYTPNYFSSTGDNYDDPLRCPSTGSPRDCNTQFTTQLGGNANLEPERSTSYSAGVVWEPANWATFGVDYWNVKVRDVIATIGEASIFTDIPAAEAAGLLVRFAPGSAGCPPQAGGLPCPINYGVQTNINLTKLETSGLDFTINVRSPKADFGALLFGFTGTYMFEWKQQEQGGEEVDLIGTYGGGVAATVLGPGSSGAFPRWKHNATLGWTYGNWAANLNQVYVDGYTDAEGERRVSSYSVWGLNGSYLGFKNVALTLGVKNLFDRDPPYTRQAQAFQIGYDPALADPTGRFWYANVRFTFK